MEYREFAAKIKAKYPQYADMDDRDLATKLVTRHPEYADITFEGSPLSERPSTTEITKTEAAKQAGVAALKSDVPGLAPVAEALRNDIPQAIANAGEKVGFPVTGATVGTVVGTAGELVPKTGGELALAALGGPIIKRLGGYAAKAAPTVVSKLSGRSLPEATRAITRAKELMNPVLLRPETIDKATEGIGTAMKAARSSLGRRLGVAEDAAIARNPDRVLKVGGIGDELAGNFQRRGYSADGVRLGDHANPLPPEMQSMIDRFRNNAPAKPGSGLVDRYGVELPGTPAVPRDMALRDALQLKKDIYEMTTWSPDVKALKGVGTAEEAFLKDAAKNLDDHIRMGAAADPALNEATDKFSRMGKAYGKLEKTALSGQVDTVQKRLGRIFNAGDIERKVAEPLAAVNAPAVPLVRPGTPLPPVGPDPITAGQAHLDTLLDAKTAQAFQPWISPYVERAAKHTGGGLLGAGGVGGAMAAKALVGGPAAATGMGAVVGLTSPRVINSAIRAAVVPIGESAVVDAAASPAARALVANPVMRRLQRKEKR